MTIHTRHIAAMYDEAARLARLLESADVPTVDAELTVAIDGAGLVTVPEVLERIDNLVAHAKAELKDEHLRARHHWPVV